jgi:hypothetical protein
MPPALSLENVTPGGDAPHKPRWTKLSKGYKYNLKPFNSEPFLSPIAILDNRPEQTMRAVCLLPVEHK